MNKENAVFAIFQEVSTLKRAAMALGEARFRNTTVSVLFPDRPCPTNFTDEKRGLSKGLAVGSEMGAIVGGILGWLTGKDAFTIPRMNSFAVSSPLGAALAGLGVGVVVGALVGSLVHRRIRAHRSTPHEDSHKSGGFLLSVHCDDGKWVQLAELILKNAGADAVSFSGNAAA